MYGICCSGGPKKRALSVGKETIEYAANDGVVFYFPEEKFHRFQFKDNYCYVKRKDAEADLKKAREARVSMFLPYDGFSACRIVKNFA